MDGNSHNATRELIRWILANTHQEQHSTSVQCHYIHCTFSINDYDDHNSTCRVTPIMSIPDEIEKNSNAIKIAQYIRLYIYPVFILMGIFGNKLSCFIMFFNARRSGYPASLYLTLLALVDCLYILTSALPDWMSEINSRFNIKILSDFSCRLVYFFGNFTTHLSAGLVVGVTVERFIAVQYPLIAHKINTITHTRIVLLILTIFFFLLDTPIFTFVKHINESIHIVLACKNETSFPYTRHDTVRCGVTGKRYEQKWVYIDFAVYNLIPFVIIITLNSLIIRRLIDAQRFRQRMFRFSNYSSRQSQQDIKHRHCSKSHQTMEMNEKQQQQHHHHHHHHHFPRFQSVSETKPLVILLHPQLSQSEERRLRYSTKQSSTSTELSTISYDMKNRSRHQYEMSSIRHKSINTSNSNHTRLTILLLFVSCSFLLLTLPAVVWNLIMSIKLQTRSSILQNIYINSITTDNTDSLTVLYYTLARLLMIINHSINFILYFVLGKRFRHDLKQLFMGYWRRLYR
ncbi:unnamed protein product [Rotaria sp. Silwood1]|nr:unnamed protein product [Rotaria sp. Silwood1]CAF0838081.1 unnamed protein product [Rotaria sp. Silwood1]CAF3369536.1 unnamed protein product [Rotaria sp. Silwood1]CAF3400304.1 unnamed protein product [Rotaria sp. Silwood1]CAF3403905.1 unnamed protein product [Rotaria sp. Silwood1]